MTASPASTPAADPVAALFLALAVVILTAALLSRLAIRWRQPGVIGEILAGIVLGPCLLGLLPGDPMDRLVTESVRTVMEGLAQVGLACYLFGVGREADLGLLRRHRRTTAAVASAALIVPLSAGPILAWLLVQMPAAGVTDHPDLGPALAVALSVTAVPVLARILEERDRQATPAGVVALGSATLGDVVSWCLLAVLVTRAESGGAGSWWLSLTGLAVLVIVMATVGRAVMRRVVEAGSMPTPVRIAVVAGILCTAAAATTALGLHAVFGALLCGMIFPRATATGLRVRNQEITAPFAAVGILFLPAFFVTAGLRMQPPAGGLGATTALVTVIVVVAVATKVIPAALAARACGMPVREAWTVGALMNTRGLTELVVLSVMLGAGIIDATLYTALVVVTLITTMMTGPLLRSVGGREPATRPADRPLITGTSATVAPAAQRTGNAA